MTTDRDQRVDLNQMVPFGLQGSQVNYIIETLKLQGQCEYISGLLYAPEIIADQITAIMHDYPAFKQTVETWENTPRSS